MITRNNVIFIFLTTFAWATISGTPWAQHPTDSEVNRLIEKLKNQNLRVRARAMSALGKMGPDAKKAVPALIKAMRLDAHLQKVAARALGQIGPEARQAVPTLIDVLTRKLEPPPITPTGPNGTFAPEDPLRWKMIYAQNRLAVVRALGKMGPDARKAVPALIESLRDEYRHVRLYAAWALGKLGPDAKKAVPALIAALKDKNQLVPRYAAAWALGKMGAEAGAAVPVLLKLLKDEDKDVRRHAARALGRIGSSAKDVVAALSLALKDEDKDVRKQAAKALRIIKDN